MDSEVIDRILSMSDKELDNLIATTKPTMDHWHFAVNLRQKRQLEKLAKPSWIAVLTLVFTVLCFLAAAVAAFPILLSWLR